MIGSIEVKVTAHSPQKPITPFFTFKDSPSSLRIIDVPKSIGDWNITEVRVVIEYPDGVTVARGATRNGNVWVATIEGTSTTGKVVKGCQILANGIDEQGQEVTGYVLGIGDVFVLERDSTISPSDDDEYYTVKYCEETPTNPQKGNLIIEDEIVKIWNGEEWFIVGGGDDKRDYADLTFAPLTMNNDPAHYGIESFDLYANGSLFTLSHFNIGNHTWYNENAGYSIVGLSKDYFAVYSSGVYQPIATFSRTSDSQTSWEFVYSGMTMTVSATPMTSTTIALANAVPWRTTELNNDAGFITANSQVFQQIQQDISALASSMPSKVSDLPNDAQYVTKSEVTPFTSLSSSPLYGFASNAENTVNMVGMWDGRTPDTKNALAISLKPATEKVGELVFSTRKYPSWFLSMYNGTTYDPPLEMTYGWRNTVSVVISGRVRQVLVNNWCWAGAKTNVGSFVLLADASGNPLDTFYVNSAAYEVTYNDSMKMSIATIGGETDKIICERTSRNATYYTRNVAFQDETLPLTAGSSHTITGDLYISAGRGCVVGSWAMLHEDSKLQFYNGDLGVGYYFPDTISVGQSEMTQIATTSYVDSQIGAVLSEQM